MPPMDSLMPRFGRANNGPQEDGWADVDNFDVEMLAEYLLDDGKMASSGVTFDFNIDNSKFDSTMVSPENSEDGNLPPIAEAVHHVVHQAVNQVPGMALMPMGAYGLGGMPLAPAPQSQAPMYTPLPNQVPNIATMIPNVSPNFLQAHQHPQVLAAAAAVLPASSPKRRRVDAAPAPLMAMAGLPNGAAMMINGQQLAAAAAQVMKQGRGRKKSQAQIDRRRERNRILARRTRLRKKFFFESLQKEVVDLQRENQVLKDMVKVNLDGDVSKKILDECDAAEKLPEGVLEACGEHAADMDQQDFNLVSSIQKSQHSFLITDPSLQDNPIVFASEAFLTLTGYTREQVLGRNCRFLQGTETRKEKIDEIRKALSVGDDVTVTLVNYMSDGTPFWNKLFIAALRDAQNNIVNFIGVIVKVSSPEPADSEFGREVPGLKTEHDEFDDDDDDDDHDD